MWFPIKENREQQLFLTKQVRRYEGNIFQLAFVLINKNDRKCI